MIVILVCVTDENGFPPSHSGIRKIVKWNMKKGFWDESITL